MKKIYFSTTLLFILLAFFAHGQEMPAKWSLGVKGGLDLYRVSPAGPLQAKFSSLGDRMGWDGGLFVEFSPNANYGFGIDGGFIAFNRDINDQTHYANTIDVTLFGSLNLTNLAAPCRTGFWERINMYAKLGGGMGFYTHKFPGQDDYSDRRKTLVGTGGLSLELNLNPSFALLLEGQYRYYSKRDMGGSASTHLSGNDALVANLGLRWKIGANKKAHVRNMTNCTVIPPVVEKELIGEPHKELNERLNVAEMENKTLDNKVQQLQNENKAVKDKVQQLENEINNMKTQATRATSVLERELKNLETLDLVNVNLENIEFHTGSYVLTDNSKKILNEMAEVLKGNTAWKTINISGHTDNTGNQDFNRVLSESRAKSVQAYLIERGVDSKKLNAIGFGSSKPIANNDTEEGRQLNRRVEFEILK